MWWTIDQNEGEAYLDVIVCELVPIPFVPAKIAAVWNKPTLGKYQHFCHAKNNATSSRFQRGISTEGMWRLAGSFARLSTA